MNLHFKTTVARLANIHSTGKLQLASYIRGRIDARRRRIEHEREFYRKLGAYCRANNLSCVCEDDWKMAAYAKNDDKLSKPT
jgi:hypothetical protein